MSSPVKDSNLARKLRRAGWRMVPGHDGIGIVIAAHLADLAELFILAKTAGFRIAPVGFGNSYQLQPPRDAISVRLEAACIEWHAGDTLCVGAGNAWTQVAEVALLRGRGVPVLTSYPHVSVGGTISHGGYGQSSLLWGSQAENVQSLELLTARGEVHQCSPESNSDLFFAALAGRGRAGVLGRMTIPTLARKESLVLTSVETRSLADLVAACNLAFDLPARSALSIKGQYFDEQFRLLVASEDWGAADVWRENCPGHSRVVKDWDVRCLQRPVVDRTALRAWRDYVVNAREGVELAGFIEDAIQRHTVFQANAGQLLVLAARGSSRRRPLLLPTSTAANVNSVGIGVYMNIPRGDQRSLAAAGQLHEEILDACLRLEGRPYVAGGMFVRKEGEERGFGTSLVEHAVICDEHDPGSVLYRP